jgi:hypothetical protein
MRSRVERWAERSWVFFAIIILSPIYVAIAWAVYLGAKWLAAFIAQSDIDQTVMAAIAVIIVLGLVAGLLVEAARD